MEALKTPGRWAYKAVKFVWVVLVSIAAFGMTDVGREVLAVALAVVLAASGWISGQFDGMRVGGATILVLASALLLWVGVRTASRFRHKAFLINWRGMKVLVRVDAIARKVQDATEVFCPQDGHGMYQTERNDFVYHCSACGYEALSVRNLCSDMIENPAAAYMRGLLLDGQKPWSRRFKQDPAIAHKINEDGRLIRPLRASDHQYEVPDKPDEP